MGSVLIDATVYFALTSWTGLPSVSKAMSYIAGATFTFLANWKFTFGEQRGKLSIIAFLAVYATSLALNVGINAILLEVLGGVEYSGLISYAVATVITVVWNFLGQYFLVFREIKRDEINK